MLKPKTMKTLETVLIWIAWAAPALALLGFMLFWQPLPAYSPSDASYRVLVPNADLSPIGAETSMTLNQIGRNVGAGVPVLVMEAE